MNNDVLELRRNGTHVSGVFSPQVSFAPGKRGSLGAVSRVFEGELKAHNQVLVSTPFTSSATYRIYVEVAGIPTSLVIDTGDAVTHCGQTFGTEFRDRSLLHLILGHVQSLLGRTVDQFRFGGASNLQ